MTEPLPLATHAWGSGDRVVVLLHGMYNHGGAWAPLARTLADSGYRAVAVDLPGHGESPRSSAYPKDLMVESVVAAVPEAPALLLGHSLGGYLAQATAPRLRPERQILVDPAFDIIGPTEDARQATLELMTSWIPVDPDHLARDNPRWSEEARLHELRGRDHFDPTVLTMLLDTGYAEPDTRPMCPSLVLKAEHDTAVSADRAALLAKQGHEVVTVAGTGHNIDRDDPAAFTAEVLRWLAAPGATLDSPRPDPAPDLDPVSGPAPSPGRADAPEA
ncbi:alpha/beta fold hydrolase [Demequina salsinemoris]|uniref:alpha/beta fold hydrolase n=1 Tax=Demequina salsinemoris TaxID=577470 RepID=UPI00078378A6|nr:alpha/beta fold hydrolase [Demequina salsinemoris]